MARPLTLFTDLVVCFVLVYIRKGLGIMGDGMARNLLEGGRDLIVWNRTGSKAADFSQETGCGTAKTPKEVRQQKMSGFHQCTQRERRTNARQRERVPGVYFEPPWSRWIPNLGVFAAVWLPLQSSALRSGTRYSGSEPPEPRRAMVTVTSTPTTNS